MRSDYIPTLDGWRAVAILLVLFCHAGGLLFGHDGLLPSARGENIAAYGLNGVDLFFALSGFLITSKLITELNRTGTVDLYTFYRRRFFRILPAYWTFLVVLGFASITGLIVIDRREFLSCLVFVRNYSESFSWYTGHLWSLAVEEHYYLLWPPAMSVLMPRRARWVGVCVALAIEIWRAIDSRLQLAEHWSPGIGSTLHRTDTRFDCLLWGSLVAISFPTIVKCLSKLPPTLGHAAPVVLVIAITCGVICSAPLQPLWKGMLLPLLLATTVIFARSPLSLVLEAPILRWIGRLSYSLYLWHVLFLTPLPARSPRLHSIQTLPLAIVAAFTFAAASYYLVERPFLALGRKKGRRHECAAA